MSTQPTPNTGLDANLVGQLNTLASTLTPAQLAWVGGYFTGLSAQGAGAALPAGGAVSGGNPDNVFTILYGSQTGHARSVAEELRDAAQEAGLAVDIVSMGKLKEKNLKKLKYVAVITSTQGEGDPPDDALNLVEYMNSNKAPKLQDFQFAVLGLGDSSYEFYCKTGKDFDARFEELGGKRILDRVDLDVDFDDGAEAWIPKVVDAFKGIIPEGGGAAAPAMGSFGAVAPSVNYSRKKPLQTRLLTCQKITGRKSEKDIRHIEIDLEGSGLTYNPGDALGIYFKNDEELVNDLLELLKTDPTETVHVNDEPKSVKEALLDNYELTLLHPAFVTEYAEITEAAELIKIASETESLREYVDTRQIIDVVREYPNTLNAETFIGLLRKLTPRLYSIASSQSEVEEEVHLTVGVVEYEAHGYPHLGGASGYLGHRLNEGEDVLIYVEHNDNFRLPEDTNKPVIMIGPGTGIAPFRAFVQERAAQEAPGDSWLFFGNPHFTEDFLYQTEWQEFLEDGALTKIDLAFSRDQKDKVYVQHRIAEQAQELWNWLQRGAHIYVCGDESRMAHDVHQALLDVIAEKGGYSTEEAEDYLVQLRKDGRYQKDVY